MIYQWDNRTFVAQHESAKLLEILKSLNANGTWHCQSGIHHFPLANKLDGFSFDWFPLLVSHGKQFLVRRPSVLG
jgi:hypothetical protein